MTAKARPANFIYREDQVLVECPFCGMNLIKTNYGKLTKLLEETTLPRGKICDKCGGVVVLQLDERGKRKVLAKVSDGEVSEELIHTDSK